MPGKNTTHEINSPAGLSGPSNEQGLSVEKSHCMHETFVARRSGDFEIVLPCALIGEALEKLIETTGSPDFHDAMELVWFKSDPERDPGVRETVSMLLTLYRCSRDGNVNPPVDLEALYAEKYHEPGPGRRFSHGGGGPCK